MLSTLRGTGTIFIGDGARAYRDEIQRAMGETGRVAAMPTPLLAGMIATLAAVRADAYSPPHAIRPLYVRRTDAELARDARAAG